MIQPGETLFRQRTTIGARQLQALLCFFTVGSSEQDLFAMKDGRSGGPRQYTIRVRD